MPAYGRGCWLHGLTVQSRQVWEWKRLAVVVSATHPFAKIISSWSSNAAHRHRTEVALSGKPKQRSSSALTMQEWGLLLLSVVLSAFLAAVCSNARHQPYFSFVALIPIFVAVRVCVPWQGALCGAVWGLTLSVLSVLGVGASIPLSPPSILAVIALPAGYVWFGTALTTRIGFSPFVLAVGWMGLEAALSPTGMMNHSGLVDRTWPSVFGSMVAPLLIGFCVALVNAIVLEWTARFAVHGGQSLLKLGGDIPQKIDESKTAFAAALRVLSLQHPRAPPWDAIAFGYRNHFIMLTHENFSRVFGFVLWND